MSQSNTEPDHQLTGYPPGVPYIIGNEGCERFSFYGMKAILYVYILGLFVGMRGLPYGDAAREATATNHLFIAGVYCVPIIGGIIADRLLGKYRTIMYLSVVYCLGHLALALFEDPALQQSLLGTVLIDPIQGLGLGLFLICLGSGGIKPCVSAHVGDQFGKSNWHLLQKIFNAFYFIINFGSFFSTLLIPAIRGSALWSYDGKTAPIEQLVTAFPAMSQSALQSAATFSGYEGSVGLAFGVPGILMGLATIAFWMGRKVFIHVPASPGGTLGLMDAVAGSTLFVGLLGWPIWFAKLTDGSTKLVAEFDVVDLGVSAACLVTFAVVFSARQRRQQDDGFLAIMFWRLFGKKDNLPPAEERSTSELDQHAFWGPAVRKFGLEATEGPVAVLNIVSVFFLVSVFWALFDQHSSTWVAQATQMDRTIDLTLGGWLGLGAVNGAIFAGALLLALKGKSARLPAAGIAAGVCLALSYFGHLNMPVGGFVAQPDQVSALNPIMVMVLIPYTTFGLYPLMAKLGVDPHPLRRMTIGMFMSSLAYVTVALIQRAMDSGEGPVHVAWQLIPYVIMTLSEVMVSVTGLEFAYRQAPKKMKSVIMGFWLLMVTVGSLLVVFLAGFKDLSPEDFFWVFAGLAALASLIFGVRAKFYRYREYTQ